LLEEENIILETIKFLKQMRNFTAMQFGFSDHAGALTADLILYNNEPSEILVTTNDPSSFFCPRCEELHNELKNYKIDAQLRQCALNMEMYLKLQALGYLMMDKLKCYQCYDPVEDFYQVDMMQLSQASLARVITDVYESGNLNEFFKSLNISKNDFKVLRMTLGTMKGLFNAQAHPTTSLLDKSVPITFPEIIELINNCPAIINKDIVLEFATKLKLSSDDEDYLQSFN